MRNTFLEFEQPLAELEGKIEELRYVQSDSAVDISEELSRLQQKARRWPRTFTPSSRLGKRPWLLAIHNVHTPWTM